MQLQKATRKKVKIKMSLASPTGFGKTISALLLGYGITHDWDKIAVIDTENESASLYSNHRLANGFLIGEFQTIQLAPPFEPEKYTKAIRICEDAGIEVIIIDSITHVWQGQGGLLEYNTSLGSNSFQNWAKTTPRYQKWLDSILQAKCHIITTNRKKQAYAMVEENGKKKVEKQGMEDQIRDGYDYEMTIAFEIVNDLHLARPAKDRTGLFADKPEFVISVATGEKIREWCETGAQDIPQKVVDKMTTQEEADQIVPPGKSMVHISQPANDQPAMSEEERQYRIATNDVEIIYELIDSATDPKLLRVFHSVNNKFFKTNPEVENRLIEKGKSLAKTSKDA